MATEHIEGRLSVLAALQAAQRRFQVILVRHGIHADKLRELVELATARNVPIRYVERDELDSLAHAKTHGGVIAICTQKPRMSQDGLLELVEQLREPPLLLLLEGVDDARNLGFTLRTADAMGVHAVLIKKHLWDFDTVEIARPSSGAYERMPLVQIDELDLLGTLKRRGMRIVGCLASARRSIQAVNLAKPTMLAIGGEKRGLSGKCREYCDRFATIPTRGGPSSLSLSHAAAIVLFEAYRQRGSLASEPRVAGGG